MPMSNISCNFVSGMISCSFDWKMISELCAIAFCCGDSLQCRVKQSKMQKHDKADNSIFYYEVLYELFTTG